MAKQRVQMLLEPRQRKKLAELAKLQGKSIADVTRQAIDAGLEKLSAGEHRERMLAALEAARKLRESMPVLDVDIVADIQMDVPVRSALDWATRLRHKAAYAGFYLAAAEQLGAALWTADQALANHAGQIGMYWMHWIGGIE